MVQHEHRTVTTIGGESPLQAAVPLRFLAVSFSRGVWLLLWLGCFFLLVVPTICFLILAFSPAAFEQGSQWLTLQSFALALQGPTLRGLLNSLVVGTLTALLAVVVATGLAWLVHRTAVSGRTLWNMLVWALLLAPSYMSVLGWESLVERNGVLAQLGIDVPVVRHLVMGPAGVVWILATKGIPFAYLAVSAGMQGLGREFEDAARVHGARPWQALRAVIPMLAPALWSAAAIVFAESISDFGVASTLAAGAHFPLATYTLFLAIDSTPIQLPVASAIGWFLVAGVALALVVQYRALKGRSYAVLSGRTRLGAPRRLGSRGHAVALVGIFLFFGLALGVPALGAVSASLLKDFGSTFSPDRLTFGNYHRALTSQGLLQPLLLSARLAALTATFAVVAGMLLGRLLSRRRLTLSGRLLDLFLLGAIALPSIVLAAGYIFAYNLPIWNVVGIELYGTLFLLGMGYLASALPSTTRLLVGPLALIQGSLIEAARVHGAGEARASRTILVPLIARALLWAWLLTFTGTLLELPLSQLLYPPDHVPLAVAIIKHLENYDFAGGSAMMVIAVAGMLVVIGVALLAFRLIVPGGWQQQRRSR